MCCFYLLMNRETALGLIGKDLGREDRNECWKEGQGERCLPEKDKGQNFAHILQSHGYDTQINRSGLN